MRPKKKTIVGLLLLIFSSGNNFFQVIRHRILSATRLLAVNISLWLPDLSEHVPVY